MTPGPAPARRLCEREVAIFLFHGVIATCDYRVRNYTRKHLPRDEFVAVIDSLSRAGHAMSLPEIVEHCVAAEPFPPRAFAVTFDDGFENNSSVAAPILADFGVPATFYVTTGFIEHNAMSWIDRIEDFMEHTSSGTLRLPWTTRPHSFDDTGSRIAVLEHIRHHAKRDRDIDPDALASDIFAQGRVAEIYSSDDPVDRKMSWKQVAALARTEGFTVGGHGHTHRIMTSLDDDELQDEVTRCLDLLTEKASLVTEHYSYPEGLDYCYSNRVADVLGRHGIVCCPTAEDGTNPLGQGLFGLKRIAVA